MINIIETSVSPFHDWLAAFAELFPDDKVVRCPTCPKEFRQLSSQIKHRNSECKKTTSTEIETKGLEITGDSSSFEPGGFLIQTGAAQFLDKQPEKPQFPNNSKGSSRSEQKQSQSSGMDTGHAILAGPLDGWHRTARQPMATPSTSPRLGQGDTGGEVGVMDKSNHSENREKDMSQREDEFLLSDGEQTEVNNDAAAAQTGKSDAATVDQPRIPAESNSSGMTGSEHGNQETILVPNSSNQVSEDAHATRIRASAGSLAGVDASSNGSVADAQGSDDPMQEERPAKRVRWMTGWAMAQSANGNTYFQREVLNMNTTRNSEAANSSRSVPRQQHESSGSPNVAVNNVLKCILWKR